MAIWAIADLHLSLGIPNKSMEVFGPNWDRYVERMAEAWQDLVQPADLVLIAGDISWAMRMDEVQADLNWIERLPGKKVLLRGNHDFWWGSATQVRRVLPPSIHILSNDAFHWEGVSIGGSRLWDTNEYTCGTSGQQASEEDEKIYAREILRLELSLKQLKGDYRIAMTHYPPIGYPMAPTRATSLLQQYHVTKVVFGHLHGISHISFGLFEGIDYFLTSSDYLGFIPKKIF